MTSHPAQLISIALISAVLLAWSPWGQAAGAEESRAPQLTVELKEKDAGKPVGGVTVTVGRNWDEEFAKQTTGNDGCATIILPKEELQNLWVNTSLDGWVSMAVYWGKRKEGDRPPENITIQMERATRIGGRVVDDAGQPVAGATVVLHVHKKYPDPSSG